LKGHPVGHSLHRDLVAHGYERLYGITVKLFGILARVDDAQHMPPRVAPK